MGARRFCVRWGNGYQEVYEGYGIACDVDEVRVVPEYEWCLDEAAMLAASGGGQWQGDESILSIGRGDPLYPETLLWNWAKKAPENFTFFGNISLARRPVVSISGARDASETACMLAYKCGRLIAELGYVVASGYARGIDMHAHRGALDAGGDTIAVLPYGIKKFRMHRSLASEYDHEFLKEHMLVLSEFPMSLRFTTACALRRNECLVNLAGAVIVIEPGKTGGTWYTANYAGKKGRPLFFLEGEREEVIEKLEKIGGKRLFVNNGAPDLEPMDEQIGR